MQAFEEVKAQRSAQHLSYLFGGFQKKELQTTSSLQAFEAVKARTSTFPFQAIWEGRQQLPQDYYKARGAGFGCPKDGVFSAGVWSPKKTALSWACWPLPPTACCPPYVAPPW